MSQALILTNKIQTESESRSRTKISFTHASREIDKAKGQTRQDRGSGTKEKRAYSGWLSELTEVARMLFVKNLKHVPNRGQGLFF